MTAHFPIASVSPANGQRLEVLRRPDASFLVTIHDVSPEVLSHVSGWLELVESRGARAILGVIPDRSWSDPDIEALHRWASSGHVLALHGYSHRAVGRRSLAHRLHSVAMSGNCAENFGRSPTELATRLEAGVRFFRLNGFRPPTLYIPPAWVRGALPDATLRAHGLLHVETLAGYQETATSRHSTWPLLGFEATTWLRSVGLSAWNASMRLIARKRCRVAIHPYDGLLPLGAVLRRLLLSQRLLAPDAAGR